MQQVCSRPVGAPIVGPRAAKYCRCPLRSQRAQWAAAKRPADTTTHSSNNTCDAAPQAAANDDLRQVSTMVALLALSSSSSAAQAKTLEVDVPDDVFDLLTKPLGLLIHSPVAAIGAGVLALLLFPKLIRLAINYLAIPAIAAMLAWLAISYPQQTASSVYATLEFVKEHPAASSIGVVVAAGVFLGPDLLAGAAVTGVLVLLASQLGLVQLPQLPRLPRLPGQQVVAQQLEKAGRAVARRVDQLDGERGIVDLSKEGGSGSSYHYDSSSSSSKGGPSDEEQQRRQRRQQQRLIDSSSSSGASLERQQLPAIEQRPPLAAPSVAAEDTSQAAASSSLPAGGLPLPDGLSGLGRSVGAAGKSWFGKIKATLPEPAELQSGLQKAGEGLGSRVQGLQQQVLGSGGVSGLRDKAAAAAARAQQAAGAGAGLLRGQVQQLQQQVAGGGGGAEVTGHSSSSGASSAAAAGPSAAVVLEQARSGDSGDDDAGVAGSRSRLDSILSNS